MRLAVPYSPGQTDWNFHHVGEISHHAAINQKRIISINPIVHLPTKVTNIRSIFYANLSVDIQKRRKLIIKMRERNYFQIDKWRTG